MVSLILICITIIVSIIDPISILAQEYLIDTVEDIIGNVLPIGAMFMPIVFLCFLSIVPNIHLIGDYLKIKWNADMDAENILELQDKLKKIPYVCFESNEFYDKVQYLKENNRLEIKFSFVLQVLEFIINTVLYVYVLIRYSWILPILCLVFLPCTTYFITKFSKEHYNKLFSLTFDQRMAEDKMNILTEKEYAKEVRVFGASGFVQKGWERLIKGFNKEYLKSLESYSFSSKLIFISQYIPVLLCLGVVLFLYWNQKITLAAFIAVSNHLLHMNLLKLYQGVVSHYSKYKLVCKKHQELNEIMQKEEGEKKLEIEEKSSIEIIFEHVFFRYPNTDTYVLEDVSFQLKGKQRVVLVGENGSGKSTLIKLLLGLYKAERVKIFINGVEINELSRQELSKLFGCAFQDYARYALSLRENVGFGEGEEEWKGIMRDYGIDKIARNLKDSYDTILGKLYGDGVELSGGEWQKVGIARAFVGNKKVLIFDEPTASLDPIAEVNTFQNIIEHSKESMTFLVTHRLGIASQVNQILVLNQGKVCEIGDFEELMKKRGKFYQLYETQRKLYIREEGIE